VDELAVHDKLFKLQEGKSYVTKYALQFRTLAVARGMRQL